MRRPARVSLAKLSRYSFRPAVFPALRLQTAHYATSKLASKYEDEQKPLSVGIVGGGICGLSAAYELARIFKKDNQWTSRPLHITIYEANDKLGGWMNTRKVPIDNDGHYIRLEMGPRTLTAGVKSIHTLRMLEDIGMTDSVCFVSKDEPAARNRFIYLGEDGLYRMPVSLWEMIVDLTEKNSKMWPTVKHVVATFFTKLQMPEEFWEHKSLGSLASAWLGKDFVDKFLSAMIHGIYAGDVYKLLPESPGPWLPFVLPQAFNPSSLPSLMRIRPSEDWMTDPLQNRPWANPHFALTSRDHTEFTANALDSFVFYVREGLGYMILALQSYLRLTLQDRFQVRTSTPISKVNIGQENEPSSITTLAGETIQHDHIITTNSLKTLPALLSKPAPHLPASSYASVATVTLYYNQSPLQYSGFGYVVSAATPADKNPHGCLGVIFDSVARPQQDATPPGATKLTVMLGGRFWTDRIAGGQPLPDRDTLERQAVDTLAIQLGMRARPDLVDVQLMRDAIHQPTLDYLKAQRQLLHIESKPGLFDYPRTHANKSEGPGVHDAVREGFHLAADVLRKVFYAQPRSVAEKFDVAPEGESGGRAGEAAAEIFERWQLAELIHAIQLHAKIAEMNEKNGGKVDIAGFEKLTHDMQMRRPMKASIFDHLHMQLVEQYRRGVVGGQEVERWASRDDALLKEVEQARGMTIREAAEKRQQHQD